MTTTTFKSFSAKSGAVRAVRKLVGDEPSNYLAFVAGAWGYYVRGKTPVSFHDVATALPGPSEDDEPESEDTTTFNPNAFAALVGSQLGHDAEQAEAHEEAAIAAIAKARRPAPAKSAGAVKPALTAAYRFGVYNGRAGAMFGFMKRLSSLGDTVSRESALTSILAKPCHADVATRAQVLDYFAWAARHGLLVEATSDEVAAAQRIAAEQAQAQAELQAQAEAAKATA